MRPIPAAIHTAGVKRLRAIIMTSLITIFVMVLLFFSFDLGSELQKPLALAMIGTMVIGILVSLLIDFIGGEPLLEMELINKISDYVCLLLYSKKHK